MAGALMADFTDSDSTPDETIGNNLQDC